MAIGCSFYLLEHSQSFDLRFKLRGPQPLMSDMLVIDIQLHEWERTVSRGRTYLRQLREFTTLDDSFFWNERVWENLLSKLLRAEPKSIGVSFFFPPGLLSPSASLDWKTFRDPRITWLGRTDAEGRSLYPFAALADGSNVGVLGVRLDEDRVVRKYQPSIGEANIAESLITQPTTLRSTDSYILNYRLPAEKIPRISLSEVLDEDFDLTRLKNKILIVGTSEIESHLLRTPLGDMNRAEVIATQVDNIINQRFIQTLPVTFVVLILLIHLVLCIWLMSSYPQSIAFVFLAWVATGWTAFSIWVFDTYSLWLPVLAPVAQISVTYVVFLGYQLTKKENEAWRLEQEKKYISEIEQLKNNFVSLFSHDLKTPIAKIQAICDRLLSQQLPPDIHQGLQSLRQESSELHRYIQSILKMSRVESKNFKINREVVDINEMIENVEKQLHPLIQQKSLKFELELEPIFSIEVDSLLLQEVILNLIENAVKYTPAGGQVRVRSQEIENEVVFSVEDSGPGISKDDQERIFEKFYRSPEQELSTKGTGLGLYLVKYFIELHGGRVFLESAPGEGTRIGFRLPTDEESVQVRPLSNSPIEVKQ